MNPDKSNKNYEQDTEIKQLAIGDKVFDAYENKFITLFDIESIVVEQITYTLELTKGNNFIANGLLVKTEKPKWTK